jgi:hypothetical protein
LKLKNVRQKDFNSFSIIFSKCSVITSVLIVSNGYGLASLIIS